MPADGLRARSATSVCVGIPFRERADLLADTLRTLRAATPDVTTVVLADAPDAEARLALRRTACERILLWERTRGDPGCFNVMVTENEADVYVLLENGARVAPGWLERMLQGLASDDSHGLCGPSTNRSWNEQQAFAGQAGDDASLACAAREAAHRFGGRRVAMTPLHSLADFCYAVAREVVDRVGAADEGYGEGPCWEMDYNIRAARAGFRAVWAQAAFVWRAPATARRQAAEARRFRLSQRRYQDHFCALRLRGESTGHEPHCRGEACEHFAPRDLVTVRREFAPREPHTVLPSSPWLPHAPPEARVLAQRPLVSCIMPTADRRTHVEQAIAAFLLQDYEPRELVIVDDGHEAIEDLVPLDPRIVYARRPRGQSLGRKRNEACRLARGEVIVHWDDDDWYTAWRLSYQVERLLGSSAEICGLDRLWFYDADERCAWLYTHAVRRHHWLAGGTLCYRRNLWVRQPFPDVTVGEDTRFVQQVPIDRIMALDRDDFYVARVHAGNTCRNRTNGSSWSRVAREVVEGIIDRCPPHSAQSRRAPSPSSSLPLVSCIMPTYERPRFVALALERFTEQTYPNKELIVVDDGRETVEELLAGRPGVRYVRMERRSIGEKRNVACGAARGDLIVHWDDDDWYGPRRLQRQAEPILAGEADVTGLRCRWVMSLPTGEFWRVSPDLHRRMFVSDVHGGTLMFRKSLWDSGARYPATSLAEDAALLRAAMGRGARLRVIENDGDFVYSRHRTNAWSFVAGQFIDPQQWLRTTPPPGLHASVIDGYRDAFRAVGAPSRIRPTIPSGPWDAGGDQ